MLKQLYKWLAPARLRQWLYPLWHREYRREASFFRRGRAAIQAYIRRAAAEKWLEGCVLEIGSGQETYTRDEFLAQSPTMTFLRSEISTGGYGRQASVSAGFYALLCDVTCMSFRDKSLDGVICSEVLEHVPNYQAALDEIARVLRPGGKLLITSPFVFPLHGPPDFWRFTPEAFQLLLREQFTIVNLELAPMTKGANLFPVNIGILAQRR